MLTRREANDLHTPTYARLKSEDVADRIEQSAGAARRCARNGAAASARNWARHAVRLARILMRRGAWDATDEVARLVRRATKAARTETPAPTGTDREVGGADREVGTHPDMIGVAPGWDREVGESCSACGATCATFQAYGDRTLCGECFDLASEANAPTREDREVGGPLERGDRVALTTTGDTGTVNCIAPGWVYIDLDGGGRINVPFANVMREAARTERTGGHEAELDALREALDYIATYPNWCDDREGEDIAKELARIARVYLAGRCPRCDHDIHAERDCPVRETEKRGE
jgi:hypothetical protein